MGPRELAWDRVAGGGGLTPNAGFLSLDTVYTLDKIIAWWGGRVWGG